MTLPLNQLPVIKRGWMRAIIFCIAYLGSLLLTSFIAGLAIGVAVVKKGVVDNSAVNIANLTILVLFISAVLSILLAIVFRRFIDRQSILSLGFSWQGFQQDAFTGFLLGPALLGAGSLVLFFTQNLQWTDIIFNSNDFFISLVLFMMIAVGEEIAFRGYLLNNLMESMNKWVALIVSALLFTAAHGTNPGLTVVALANLFLGGLLLGINYIYTRNLWFAILFHFSWNFFQGPLLGYEVSGIELQSVLQQEQSGNILLTGGSFGFEGSLVSTFLSIIMLLVLYAVYETKYTGRTITRIKTT